MASDKCVLGSGQLPFSLFSTMPSSHAFAGCIAEGKVQPPPGRGLGWLLPEAAGSNVFKW